MNFDLLSRLLKSNMASSLKGYKRLHFIMHLKEKKSSIVQNHSKSKREEFLKIRIGDKLSNNVKKTRKRLKASSTVLDKWR